MFRIARKLLASGLAVCASAGISLAQGPAAPAPASPNDDVQALKALVLQQQKQIDALTQRISTPVATTEAMDAKTVRSIVADYMQETGKTDPKTGEPYRVGSDHRVTAQFEDGSYLWLRTPQNDFNMHIGYWMQWDNVWWNQQASMRIAPGARPGLKQGVASGVAAGGIGNLEDGEFFRRIRPFLEGTLWETYEYRLILAMENLNSTVTGLDEFWVAVNKLPVIGTIRVGHVKDAIGLEGDMTASSRCMTFMERSSYSETIERNENFVTGVWFHNAYLDDRTTYTFTMFKDDVGASTGAFFGDGQWGWQGRLTALPLWDCDGRTYMHVGLSGGWRNGASNDAVSPLRTFQFRARPELRDDTPAGFGPANIPNANSNRMVDTGVIAARQDYLMGLEFLYVRGPLSVQAEYGWSFLNHAIGVAPAGLVLNPAIFPPHNYAFEGGYVQLAYTLTGESRAYDKKGGTLNREYFGKRGPFTNAWFVRDEDGHLNWGLGAWEVAARYSYVDLNDGSSKTNLIRGGRMSGVTVGLNWYLNNNISWSFDYVVDRRFDVPFGTIPGWVSGFGTRVQLSF